MGARLIELLAKAIIILRHTTHIAVLVGGLILPLKRIKDALFPKKKEVPNDDSKN